MTNPPPDNSKDNKGSTRNEGPKGGNPDNRKSPPGDARNNERKDGKS